jgi:uncharacterized protein (TIGR00269 family)
VAKAIKDFAMLTRDDRALVAVSGGKDSLAVWDILLELGYTADGLYLGLGIGDYSDASGEMARSFASSRGLRLIEVDLPTDHGFDIPTGAKAARRVPCSACGLSKRHLFDEAARTGGYDVVVTGHNLDDEAAVLFGNTLRWDTEYLARQLPVLPERHGFPRKVKPLVRLSERETAAYCVLRGIDYQVEECPMAVGNKHLGYKELLNGLEARSPGTKAAFLFGFLERGHERFAGTAEEERQELGACSVCGAPTPVRRSGTEPVRSAEGGDVCAFCRLREQAGVTVELRTKA